MKLIREEIFGREKKLDRLGTSLEKVLKDNALEYFRVMEHAFDDMGAWIDSFFLLDYSQSSKSRESTSDEVEQ